MSDKTEPEPPGRAGRPVRGPSLSEVRTHLVEQRLAYAASRLPPEVDLRLASDAEILEVFSGVVSATQDEVARARQNLGIAYDAERAAAAEKELGEKEGRACASSPET